MNSAVSEEKITQKIDACLPQTQCTMCGFPRCFEYAKALAIGTTEINRCPPGGNTTIRMLADLLNESVQPLADDCAAYSGRKIAQIREQDCIGCTLCIAPCPVDAIIGTAKHMHSVLASECTGCELCLEYCPVDCIEMTDMRLKSIGETWNYFEDREVSYWRNLTNRRQDRTKDANKITSISFEPSDISSEIRNSVNRERSRRWKKLKRQSRTRVDSR